MKELIDKSTIVAEIYKRIKKYASIDLGGNEIYEALYGEKCKTLIEIFRFLDTLEVHHVPESVYVVTRSEEHSDYVECAFLSENEAEEYCKPFNEDENSYARNITKVKIQ